MKRVISIIIALAMVLGLSITAPVYAETIPDVTKYSYKITPLLSPFADYLYVETNNPDPSSFRLIDESSEFFSEDSKTWIELPWSEGGYSVGLEDGTYFNSLLRYEDVVYENEATGRVAGGYIFMTKGTAYSDGGQFTLLQKTSSGSSVLHDEFQKTSVKISCPKMESYLSYLVNSFNIDGMSFFEKVDAVQEYLDNFAVYPRSVIDMDRPNEKYPYPLLVSSIYAELPVDLRFYMYEDSDASLLASKAYPYILDSLGFPGTVAAFAEEIEPECEVKQGSYHYEAEISFAGETRIYGGSGRGGNDPIRSYRVGNTFTFKNGSELNLNSTLEDYRDKLLSYREIAEADMTEWYDDVEKTPYYDRVKESGGTWVRISTEPGCKQGTTVTYGNTFTYMIPTGEGTTNVYDAWVDGCYVNKWKRIQTDVTFEDYPTAGIVKHNVTFPDAEGNNHTQDVYYRYNEEDDNWTAKFFAEDYGYYDEEQLPPAFIITREEAEAIVRNAGRPRLPNKGLIFDGTEIPGTPFTLTNVTGITLPAKAMDMYVDQEIMDFDATVSPSNAFDGGAYWTSSDESVVECYGGIGVGVASARLVAKKKGTAIITAKTYDGAYTATCTVTVKEKPPKLAAPVVTGGNHSVSGKPTLSWKKVDGAIKYEVYRSYAEDGGYVKMFTTTGTSYTNTSAFLGYTYYYKVKTIGFVNVIDSDLSDPVEITCMLATPSATGKNDAATGKNIITWNKIPDADQYEVYRSDSQNGTYEEMITTEETSYTDTTAVAGKHYYYKVEACSYFCGYSQMSASVKLTCKCATPEIIGGHDFTSGKNKITWDEVDGANKYEVYRYDSAKKAYVKTFTTTNTNYTNTGAEAGKTYYYKVRAVGSVADATSQLSSSVKLTCKYATPKVTGTNDPATGKPMLTWKKVDGATDYEVYRYDSASSSYIKLITTTGTTFKNTSAKSGYIYYYKVKAIGSVAAAASNFSDKVKLTCKYPTPKVVGSNNPTTGKNVLNWAKVTGATKYEIYRYDSASNSYIKLITTTGTTFTNTSAKPGYIYYYKVKAIGSVAAAASNFSDKVKLTCKYPTPKVTGSNNPATGKNVLNWEKVEGATKYEIYRYDSASNSYIKLITTTGTTFTNTSAKPGYIYYYKVKAVGSVADATSNFSDKVKLTCKCATPKVTGSNTTTGKPKLNWEKVDGATKYEIYRYDSASSSYIKLITTTGTTFTHTSAKPGYIYYYKVKALGATTASDSVMSDSVKITCK